MKRIELFCIVFFICISCTNKREQWITEELQHQVLNFSDAVIGSVGGIQKEGNNLVILDFKQDSIFHWIDLNRNHYIGMYGVKGQGPDEFVYPSSLNSQGNLQMACFDNGKREVRMLHLNLAENEMGFSSLVKTTGSIKFDIVPLSKSRFVLNGEINGAMFALLNENGEVMSLSDGYPYKDDAESLIPSRFRALAYQGTLRVNSNAYFAYAIRGAKQLHLYQVESDEIKKIGEVIEGYGHYTPNMDTEGSYSVMNDGNFPECYLDLAVSDNFVYALYSGRSFNEYKISAFEGEMIYVYDWFGNPVKAYRLDVPISHFCVDEFEKKIYAIANIPEPTIVKFEMN
mgnify:CR=1 FL=1